MRRDARETKEAIIKRVANQYIVVHQNIIPNSRVTFLLQNHESITCLKYDIIMKDGTHFIIISKKTYLKHVKIEGIYLTILLHHKRG